MVKRAKPQGFSPSSSEDFGGVEGVSGATGSVAYPVASLIDFVSDESVFSSDEIAKAVVASGSPYPGMTGSNIRGRWFGNIGRAIPAHLLRNGDSFTALFRSACISYAFREELYPSKSTHKSGLLWEEVAKSLFSDFPAELVEKPFDDVEVLGEIVHISKADASAARVVSELAGSSDGAIVLSSASDSLVAPGDFDEALNIHEDGLSLLDEWDAAEVEYAAKLGVKQADRIWNTMQSAKNTRLREIQSEAARSATGGNG